VDLDLEDLGEDLDLVKNHLVDLVDHVDLKNAIKNAIKNVIKNVIKKKIRKKNQKKNAIKRNVIKKNSMVSQDFMDLDQDAMDFHKCSDHLHAVLKNTKKENVNVENQFQKEKKENQRQKYVINVEKIYQKNLMDLA